MILASTIPKLLFGIDTRNVTIDGNTNTYILPLKSLECCVAVLLDFWTLGVALVDA